MPKAHQLNFVSLQGPTKVALKLQRRHFFIDRLLAILMVLKVSLCVIGDIGRPPSEIVIDNSTSQFLGILYFKKILLYTLKFEGTYLVKKSTLVILHIPNLLY